jgi:ssDNA-binding Zn-finger/Zn-ribbon topoisomerase 1
MVPLILAHDSRVQKRIFHQVQICPICDTGLKLRFSLEGDSRKQIGCVIIVDCPDQAVNEPLRHARSVRTWSPNTPVVIATNNTALRNAAREAGFRTCETSSRALKTCVSTICTQ